MARLTSPSFASASILKGGSDLTRTLKSEPIKYFGKFRAISSQAPFAAESDATGSLCCI